MLINYKQFKNIAVETKSGQYLGQLNGFELETDNGQVMKYYVRTKFFLTAFFSKELIINKEQVLDFNQSKMIVSDNLVKEKPEAKLAKVDKIEGAEPVITSDNSN